MPSRMRLTALILTLISPFAAGCGKNDRAPLDEADHLFLYSKYDDAIAVCRAELPNVTSAEDKSRAFLIVGKCQLALAAQADSDAPQTESILNEAIKSFSQSIELLDNHEARYGRQSAYRKVGSTELAASDYLKARELDPDYQSARINEKPEEIRDYTKLDMDLTDDGSEGTDETERRGEEDTTFADVPTTGDRQALRDSPQESPLAEFAPRSSQPKNQSAGFTDDQPSATPKPGGQMSEWLSQHQQRTSLPSGRQDEVQLRRSPLLDELSDSEDPLEAPSSSEPPKESEPAVQRWNDSNVGTVNPNGLGLPTSSLPTTGIPSSAFPSSSNLPGVGAPATGIGASPGGTTSGSGFAGIMPSSPTTGIGSARFTLPTSPPTTVAPSGLIPAPTFRHGVSLPRSASEASQAFRVPSAGIPADLAPVKPMPTFGPGLNQRSGPVQYGTSPLSRPLPGQRIPITPGLNAPGTVTPRTTGTPLPR